MADIIWEHAAEQALAGVPFFVRGLVRKKLEERVRNHGGMVVTLADFREAEARFRTLSAGKSDDELQRLMPRDNRPGVEMVVIEECHHAMSQCPNVLVDTAVWKQVVERWCRERDISERLRCRVPGETVLLHHKLRIVIAGCPNGCSRPQIADIGLVGYVRPSVVPESCTACGACATVCPDVAITVADAPPLFNATTCQGCLRCRNTCPHTCIHLTNPGIRVLLGGKLGRHPHLAAVAGEMDYETDVIALLDQVVDDYFDHAKSEERFADFMLRYAM